jgi:SOS-response transcriptional repressor LexA
VDLTYIPVVGTVSAENFSCVFEEEGITPMEILPVPMMKGTKAKALKVRGDCMEPVASDGDYIAVAAKAAYEDGSLVVAKVDGECTFKRIYVHGDKVLLVPDNKKYKRIEVKKEAVEVAGIVVYILRKPTVKKL